MASSTISNMFDNLQDDNRTLLWLYLLLSLPLVSQRVVERRELPFSPECAIVFFIV